jgi:hypothetical protein
MDDDKSKTDNRDRGKIAGGEDYEVQYLAETMDISVNQARELIRQHGNDRATLEREARKLGR